MQGNDETYHGHRAHDHMLDFLTKKVIADRVAMALEEDLGGIGDVTTDAIRPISAVGTALIRSKADGILCGMDAAREVFSQLDQHIGFPISLTDGTEIGFGTTVLGITGKYSALLRGERTALNFLARLSGVATLTGKAVQAVKGTGVDILDTRKTTPGFRLLEKYAVRTGGGKNHRWGLFDQYLIKENHIQAAGGITAAVESVRRHLQERDGGVWGGHLTPQQSDESLRAKRSSLPWIPDSAHASALGRPAVIEVEVRNSAEVKEALNCGVDCILLDNMSDDQIRRAVKSIRGEAPHGHPAPAQTRIEISGGVTIERLPQLAKLGVDAISMGMLTHSATAHDFSMLLRSS